MKKNHEEDMEQLKILCRELGGTESGKEGNLLSEIRNLLISIRLKYPTLFLSGNSVISL